MTVKIRVRVSGQSLRVFCPDCGHDYFHHAHGARLGEALADAYWIAESMSYHHLTAMGWGVKACPIREYAWVVEKEREHGAPPVRSVRSACVA